MSTPNPAFLTATEASEAIQAGRLSPVELVDALIERIDAHDERLHAFAAVYREDARAAAEAAHKAIRAGHGNRPLARGADRAERHHRHRGPRHHHRQQALGGPGLAHDRDARSTADRGRHDRHRQGQHRGIRHGRLGHQPAHGHTAQSVGCSTTHRAPGGSSSGSGRFGRSAPGALGHRYGHRRLRAHSVRLVRARRPQGHHRAGERGPAFAPLVAHPRHARTHDPVGGGRGTPLHGAAGARPARSGNAAPLARRCVPPRCGGASPGFGLGVMAEAERHGVDADVLAAFDASVEVLEQAGRALRDAGDAALCPPSTAIAWAS